jgi:hypothetical protein
MISKKILKARYLALTSVGAEVEVSAIDGSTTIISKDKGSVTIFPYECNLGEIIRCMPEILSGRVTNHLSKKYCQGSLL